MKPKNTLRSGYVVGGVSDMMTLFVRTGGLHYICLIPREFDAMYVIEESGE